MKLFTILIFLIFLLSCQQKRDSYHESNLFQTGAQLIKTDKKWQNGKTLKILFMGAGFEQKRLFKKAVRAWQEYVNLDFEFYEYDEKELFFPSEFKEDTIRVTFDTSEGKSYSSIGIDFNATFFKIPKMNIGIDVSEKVKFYSTSLHEIGHALGLKHEHQHPDAALIVSEADLKATCKFLYLLNIENEDELNRCRYNLSPFSKEDLIADNIEVSDYDVSSIMHYEGVGKNNGQSRLSLSFKDKFFISKHYPYTPAFSYEEVKQMHEKDQSEEIEWILEEYQDDICQLTYENGNFYLTKKLQHKEVRARVPGVSALDSWLRICMRSIRE